ncbi:MAG: acetate--CoA ligase family protein [Hydrogenophaga sp.]|nr:acetate--CoA ligase family protein [Hydrogenophaga sp.]
MAIVGASPTRTQGVNPVLNMRAYGYGGLVLPMHPTAKEFMGLPAYGSWDAMPVVPDCALFALGSDKLLPELEAAGKRGVKAAVIFASGFKEQDAEGVERERRLADIARRYGMVVCGPNCMGVADLHSRFIGYSVPIHADLSPGGVAVLSHSGSGCVALSNTGRFGMRCIVSSGNSTVIDIPEYLEHFAQDEKTRMAAVLLESIEDPAAFKEAALRMHEAGKPVVVLKNGRSAKGAAAAAAHTGAVAGPYAAYKAFFDECGVITVNDLDELVETTALISGLKSLPSGGGVGVISISGGNVTMACDLAEEMGLSLPSLQEKTRADIEANMPKFAFASNPLDARTLSSEVYEKLLLSLSRDPAISVLMVAQDSSETLTDAQARTYAGVARGVARAAVATHKPVIFYNNVAAPLHEEIEQHLRGVVPTVRGARNAFLALGKLMGRPVPVVTRSIRRPFVTREARWVQRFERPEPLSEREAKQFVAECGIRVPREVVAQTAEEARRAAQQLGLPVVMKVESGDISHKTEVGGVRVNLRTLDEVEQAFNAILKSVAAAAPTAQIHGVSVQEMVSGGVEVLVGMSRQMPFGHTLAVGWGGVQVELMQDASVMTLPFDGDKAMRALGRTKVHVLLEGYRGSARADRDALLAVMQVLCDVGSVYGDLIEAIDLNPVSVLPDGQGAMALDALIVTKHQRPLSPTTDGPVPAAEAAVA